MHIIIIIIIIIITTLFQVDYIFGERPIFNMVHMARINMYKHVTSKYWHVGPFNTVEGLWKTLFLQQFISRSVPTIKEMVCAPHLLICTKIICIQ